MNEIIKQMFPRASKSFLEANADTRLQDTVSQRSVRHESLGKDKGKEKSSGRIVLKYTSYRRRLLDIDNLAGGTKFLTDALRYCGAIPGDTEDQIDLQFTQKKVEKKEQEKTLIQINYPWKL